MSYHVFPLCFLQEWNDDTKKANIPRTVYCKGFEKEKTTIDDLLKFFHEYDGVVNVVRRTWGKDNERFFKGSTFVTFKVCGLITNQNA